MRIGHKIYKFFRGIRRHLNQLRDHSGNSHMWGLRDLDNMIINNPRRTLFYFKLEYMMAITFSFLVAFISLFFTFLNRKEFEEADTGILKHWLTLGIGLHVVCGLPKILIYRRLYRTPTTDSNLIVRRLMLLVRSNIFYYNDKTSFVLYNYYIFGITKLASSPVCNTLGNKVHRLIYMILTGVIFRLVNLFIRFVLEMSIVGERVGESDALKGGATKTEINSIRHLKLTIGNRKEILGDLGPISCPICLENLEIGEHIRLMPCTARHIFHQDCIDRWLMIHPTCPYCSHPIRQGSQESTPLKPIRPAIQTQEFPGTENMGGGVTGSGGSSNSGKKRKPS